MTHACGLLRPRSSDGTRDLDSHKNGDAATEESRNRKMEKQRTYMVATQRRRSHKQGGSQNTHHQPIHHRLQSPMLQMDIEFPTL